jgi:hypothetical protein
MSDPSFLTAEGSSGEWVLFHRFFWKQSVKAWDDAGAVVSVILQCAVSLYRSCRGYPHRHCSVHPVIKFKGKKCLIVVFFRHSYRELRKLILFQISEPSFSMLLRHFLFFEAVRPCRWLSRVPRREWRREGRLYQLHRWVSRTRRPGGKYSPPRRNCRTPLRPLRKSVWCHIATKGKNILSPCAASVCCVRCAPLCAYLNL